TGADLEERLVVEDVQPHQGRNADAVEADRVARDGGVEPADAPRSAGDRAELVAALPDLIPHLVEQLGWKWAVADARRVGLEHTQGEVDLGGGDAATCQRTAGGGVGAGQGGVGAEV